MRIKDLTAVVLVAGGCALLSGCIDPQKPMMEDYGHAVRTDLAAQVADPEPRYLRQDEPASNGPRAANAMDRYLKGQVIEPTVESTRSSGK